VTGTQLTSDVDLPTPLVRTARTMVADDKGLPAIDESIPTCHRRFAARGIPQTGQDRWVHRDLPVTTPMPDECLSGVIQRDGTIRRQPTDGTPSSPGTHSSAPGPRNGVPSSGSRTGCSAPVTCRPTYRPRLGLPSCARRRDSYPSSNRVARRGHHHASVERTPR
jgi:hypothetical protein